MAPAIETPRSGRANVVASWVPASIANAGEGLNMAQAAIDCKKFGIIFYKLFKGFSSFFPSSSVSIL